MTGAVAVALRHIGYYESKPYFGVNADVACVAAALLSLQVESSVRGDATTDVCADLDKAHVSSQTPPIQPRGSPDFSSLFRMGSERNQSET